MTVIPHAMKKTELLKSLCVEWEKKRTVERTSGGS